MAQSATATVLREYESDQTAWFRFSFKKPRFARLGLELGKDAPRLAAEV